MGHSIHKHMNSFKAKNLLSEMPIDNKASALEMDKGSAAYMKDDMAPKMESPMEKELIGGQKNLPVDLREAIEATPAKMKSDGPLYMHDDPPTAHALGNKNASTGTDGKKTIIASKMQKNYKPLKKKKLMKKEAIKTITKKKK